MTACPTPHKHRFPTKAIALKNALSLAKGRGKSVRYYKCACNQWHLTTTPLRPYAERAP